MLEAGSKLLFSTKLAGAPGPVVNPAHFRPTLPGTKGGVKKIFGQGGWPQRHNRQTPPEVSFRAQRGIYVFGILILMLRNAILQLAGDTRVERFRAIRHDVHVMEMHRFLASLGMTPLCLSAAYN